MNFLVLADFHCRSNDTAPMQIFPHRYSWSNNLDLATFDAMLPQIKNAITQGTIPTPKLIWLAQELKDTAALLTNYYFYPLF